ncbi:hypothetical protein E2C01_043501 [Portunus trituberculatus]|uniref:Uncharacterized protein n=1 Tax=Portunus trituberculatus TaxID=210409 RepID=A0A5B7FWW0_PORTR|nr:hypothetical protein [Portunus trituberculatus]
MSGRRHVYGTPLLQAGLRVRNNDVRIH